MTLIPSGGKVMDAPKRIQRKRVAGWKMPANTVSVTRPGKWGNPWKVGDPCEICGPDQTWCRLDAWRAVEKYRAWSQRLDTAAVKAIRDELSGKDLACWCKVGAPCHGDILLELANSPPTGEGKRGPGV